MAHALRSGLRNGGLRRGGLHAGLEGGSIFNIASLDLNFAKYKNIGSLVTFTRASSGTFVGSDGLIKTAVTNLSLRSEKLDEAGQWNVIGSGATLTATTDVAAPNGAMTAWTLTSSGAAAQIQQAPTGISGATYTGSFYIRRRSGTGTVNIRVSENINTPLVGVTSEWQRFSFTATSTSTTIRLGVNLSGIADAVDLWGAQLELSATVGEYIPTTSTINSAPRFNHNPITGESLGLLVEEARTNSIRNNTGVGAVAGTPGTLPTNWSVASSVSGLSSQIIGTGTESGIAYIDIKWTGTPSANGTIQHTFESNTNTAAVSDQSWTSAVYQRLVGGVIPGTTSLLVVERSVANSFLASSSTNVTVTDSALINQRLAHSRTLNNALTAYVNSRLDVSVVSGVAVDFTFRIGLPQLELGAFATSPILTSTAAATRSADVASISGSNFSSWYNQTEGTVFAEMDRNTAISSSSTVVSINDNSSNNRLYNFRQDSASALTVISATGGTLDGALGVTLANTSNRNRVAAAQSLNNLAAAANGGTVLSDTSVAMPTVSQMLLGTGGTPSTVLNGHIRRLCFWPTRLANNILQSITQ